MFGGIIRRDRDREDVAVQRQRHDFFAHHGFVFNNGALFDEEALLDWERAVFRFPNAAEFVDARFDERGGQRVQTFINQRDIEDIQVLRKTGTSSTCTVSGSSIALLSTTGSAASVCPGMLTTAPIGSAYTFTSGLAASSSS